ncbi:MAG: hypothetical protein ACP5NY_01780 [Thermocladium sp.]
MRIIILLTVIILLSISSIAFGLELKNEELVGVATGGNYVVAVGYTQSNTGVINVFTVNNGQLTLLKSITLQGELYGVAYGNNQFMIVGTSGNGKPFVGMFNPSTDSINDLSGSLGISQGSLYGVAYGNNQFMIVGTSGGAAFAAIYNGSFHQIKLPSDYTSLYSVAYGENEFMVGGSTNSAGALGIYYDGAFRDDSSMLPSNMFAVTAITYGNGEFMVGGYISSGNYTYGELGEIINNSFSIISLFNSQFASINGLSYAYYEFLIEGGLTNGYGGIGYYGAGEGGTALEVSSTEPLFPMIIYGAAPIGSGSFAYVGNDGINSIIGIVKPPSIYNVTIIVNSSTIPTVTLAGIIIRSNVAEFHLFPGSYQLEVEAPGYYNSSLSLYVNNNLNYTINLQRIKYCSLSINAIINGTHIPANITINMESQPPNQDRYSFSINGTSILSIICNSYNYEISGKYLEPISGSISLVGNRSLNISLIPIVTLKIMAPRIEGQYIIYLRGILNENLTLGNGSSLLIYMHKIGNETYQAYRRINGVLQFLGSTNLDILPGQLEINVTWLTPTISYFNSTSIGPGNSSLIIKYGLSQYGNISIMLNGTNILSASGVNGSESIYFNKSGNYDICIYSWVISNGKAQLTYGPLCIVKHVEVYYRLSIMDESGLLTNISGYYAPNSTIPLNIMSTVNLNNGTRLVYNGSIINGKTIQSNHFNITLNSTIITAYIRWIKEYLVNVKIYGGSKIINTTTSWSVKGTRLVFSPLITYMNGTRLVLLNKSSILVNEPINASILYELEYLVNVTWKSPLGIINMITSWLDNGTTLSLRPVILTYINGTRLIFNETRNITINEPLNITIDLRLQYYLVNITLIDGHIWMKKETWISKGTIISNELQGIIYQGNYTRLILVSTNASRLDIYKPFNIINNYERQWLINATILDLNGTKIGELVKWINATMPIINSTNIGNNTIPLKSLRIDGPGQYRAVALIIEKRLKINDALGLPVPLARIEIQCNGYTTMNKTNYIGYMYAMIPLNAKCTIARPILGDFSISLITAIVIIAAIIIIIRRRIHA